uniref:GIR1-like zinc ribbon domain-containing protein n=1 Tax=Arundo donax TaxID=35708 RepID=A0A0A9EXB5_ARUDO
MSRGSGSGSGARNSRLELQLNLSPPAPVGMEVDGHDDSDSSSPSSCVSSDGRSSSGSPGGKSPMVIGACTRCLMYCMVAKKDYPTCINCKQPCLVDLLHGEAGGGGAKVDANDKKRGKRK